MMNFDSKEEVAAEAVIAEFWHATSTGADLDKTLSLVVGKATRLRKWLKENEIKDDED